MVNLLLVYGGKSVEHDISKLTMEIIKQYLDKTKYNLYYLYITKNNDLKFKKDKKKKFKDAKFKKNHINNKKIDCALLLMHGTNGEDGKIQALLEFYCINYVGSRVVNSGIMQDKCYMKMILKANDIDTLDYDILKEDEEKNKNYIYPIILKPANLGSSIGIEVVYDKNELYKKVLNCFKYDDKLLIEKYLNEFSEYNIAVLGNSYIGYRLSRIEKIYKTDEILDFSDKYINQVKKEYINLDPLLKEQIENIALKVAKIFDISGVVRIDFIVANDIIYVNEINSIPGSLAFYLFDIEPTKFLDILIKNSFFYNNKINEKCFYFESDVLKKKNTIKK